MRKAKRGRDDLTRSIRKTERVSGCLAMDYTKDVWGGLSAGQRKYLSKSVASIALRRGDKILFSCSGIAMERQYDATSFLTSASFGKELTSQRNRDRRGLQIDVRHEDEEVYRGRMDEYDLDHNFTVVSVPSYLDVHVGPFQRALENLPRGEVLLAVARRVSGEIMAKNVELDGEVDEDLDKSNEAWKGLWEGCPVLFADHVVGMNLCLTTRRAIFEPWGTTLKHLEHCWTPLKMSEVFRFGARPMGEKSITYPHIVQGYYFKDLLDLDSKCYPELPSTMLRNGMVLVNTFEDTFGDTHDQCNQDLWNKLGKRANIDRNVVALASFKGGKRIFACSGFFIEQNQCVTILTSASLVRNPAEENKIVENLRIEVLFQEGLCIEGTLQDYNLHCNVALVSVKGHHARRPLNTVVATNFCEVAAVGRSFDKYKLMATGGEMIDCSGTLDCRLLKRSTCKITKAGIGGPLVNLDGDIVGMNFYDKRIGGTPYLAWEDILTVLSWFATKKKPGDDGYRDNPFGASFWDVVEDTKGVLNSWPVPMPHWRHPEFMDGDESDVEFVGGDESDDEFVSEPKSGSKRKWKIVSKRKWKYTYAAGLKCMLY